MMASGPSVAVTGASGYVGSRIVLDLLERGFAVHACVRNESQAEALRKLGARIFVVPSLTEGNFSPAFSGCVGVMHVASPVIFSAPDPEKDILRPAVDGTLNVLRCCVQAGVKRCVYTCTMASICGTQRDKNPLHIWSEADYNDAPGSWYSRSKTEAEQAAWKFVAEHPALELVTVHPSMIAGPLTIPRFEGASIELMTNLISGKYKDVPIPTRLFGTVDVREVAFAHFLALVTPAAKGQRYICSHHDQYSYFEYAQAMKRLFPHLPISDKEEKPSQPFKRGTNNQKIHKLGVRFRPLEETLKDMFDSITALQTK